MIVADVKHDTVVSGDFPTNRFAIHASAKAFNILSNNIYTNKVRAVIREYSTNAYDAHIKAGVSEPFEVHLPTVYEPVFSVRDYGFGLSESEMFDVYSLYFYSTKTDSNDLVGCLGLGSKSAYSLVDQFVVRSFQNGVVKSYSAFKGEDGCPQLALLSTEDTIEPDGIEVIVNIAGKSYEFEQEAVEVYQWFDQLPKINSTKVLEKIEAEKAKYVLTGEAFGFTGGYGKAKAIMGNVAYDIPNFDKACYIRFNIGDLEFDPGREKLSLDEKTKTNLEAALSKAKAAVGAATLLQIESEPTPFRRALKFNQMNRGLFGSFLEKHEHKFTVGLPKSQIFCYKKYHSSGKEYLDQLPLEKCEYFHFAGGYQNRIRAYLSSSDLSRVVLLTQDQIVETGIDLDLVKDLSILPKVDYVAKRSQPIKVKSVGLYSLKADTLNLDEPFVYLDMFRGKLSGYSIEQINSIRGALTAMGVVVPTIYALSPMISEKKRKNGTPFLDFVKKNVTVPAKFVMKKADGHRLLATFDDRFKGDLDQNLLSLYRTLGVAHDDYLDKIAENYFEKYPMLGFVNTHQYFDKEQVEILKGYVNELH